MKDGERTPLACGFRRRAENFVPQTFWLANLWRKWCEEDSGGPPESARGPRALPVNFGSVGCFSQSGKDDIPEWLP